MIQHEMRHEEGVLTVKPLGPLTAEDFSTLTREADGYIESHGMLNGLMISSKKFRGWKNTKGLWSHLKFVLDHHKKIKKVAFVCDSKIPELVIRIAKYFVNPEARYFRYNQEKSALNWIGVS